MRNRPDGGGVSKKCIPRLNRLTHAPLDLALVLLGLVDELLVGRLQLGDVLLQLLVDLHSAVVDLAQREVLLAQVLKKT